MRGLPVVGQGFLDCTRFWFSSWFSAACCESRSCDSNDTSTLEPTMVSVCTFIWRRSRVPPSSRRPILASISMGASSIGWTTCTKRKWPIWRVRSSKGTILVNEGSMPLSAMMLPTGCETARTSAAVDAAALIGCPDVILIGGIPFFGRAQIGGSLITRARFAGAGSAGASRALRLRLTGSCCFKVSGFGSVVLSYSDLMVY